MSISSTETVVISARLAMAHVQQGDLLGGGFLSLGTSRPIPGNLNMEKKLVNLGLPSGN